MKFSDMYESLKRNFKNEKETNIEDEKFAIELSSCKSTGATEVYIPKTKEYINKIEGRKELFKIILCNRVGMEKFITDYKQNIYDIENERELIKKAVSENGLALKDASEKLKDDYEIVKIAILNNYNSLEYASERSRGNRELVLEVS